MQNDGNVDFVRLDLDGTAAGAPAYTGVKPECEAMSIENQYYPFVNLPLPYAYDALEPFIDEKTMHLHHDRHLQTYIDNLNAALKNEPGLQKLSLEQLIRTAERLPERLGTPLKRNSGGVYNHRFYFEGLAAPSEEEPGGLLLEKISRQFGSFEKFKAAFKEAALSVFGSGYAWLVYDRGRLRILTTPNQCSPLAQGLCPLLTIDVWEHAYYLKHSNLRADYIDDWFEVVNWGEVERRMRRAASPACREKCPLVYPN